MIVRRLSSSILFGTLCVVILFFDRVAASKNGRKLSRSHFEFSVDLYRELSGDYLNKNLVVSPYSVNSVLALLFLGTSSFSSSSRQLRQVLHLDNISYVDVHKSFKDIVRNFDDSYYKSKLQAAHGVFFQQGTAISLPYIRALSEFYNVKPESLDFRGSECPLTRDTVNQWVKRMTEGQFANVLSRAPSCESKLLVVSALNLNAQLLHPFKSEDTFQKGLFFLPENKRLEVPMMSGRFELPLGYSRELECSILEMPFAQKRISLFLLLPDDAQDGIRQLERNLTANNLKMLFTTLKDEVVNVRIPKFETGATIDLRASLERLGLIEIFNKSNSDFSLMSADENIFLSEMPHRTSITLNEDNPGKYDPKVAIAAAGTRRGLFNHYFEADHPFIFLVWDYFTGMVLLMGKVVHPQMA